MRSKRAINKRIYLIYEIFLVTLAFISVIFIWYSNNSYQFIDKIVWFILFIDVLIRFILSKEKWIYIKQNPFDIIAILPFDAIFQTARIVRLTRILRVFIISKKYSHPFLSILKTNGLDKVIALSGILIFGSSIVVTLVESNIDTFADGVWWSIVTTTTVGYGDISPSTIIGRLIAVLLMLVGIGLIGMITGSITTFFVKEKTEIRPSIKFIQNQLDHFESLTENEMQELSILLDLLKQEKGKSHPSNIAE